ncbi:MAG: nreC 2 [Acidobacteria bacterium]|nr:nreC 2 [Acidobacteriota bacterium]
MLADDHVMVADAFEKLLAPSCDVVGKAGDGRALLDAVRELHPDVAVVDIAMPLLNGLTAARQIREQEPAVKIVIVTMNEDPDLAAEAFRAGASAYLLKRSAASELLAAIEQVMQDRSYVTPLVTQGMVGSLMQRGREGKRQHELTPRQREVVQLLAEGRSMKQVAAILGIAPRTVAFHKYRLMEQVGVTTNAGLIQYAIRYHII